VIAEDETVDDATAGADELPEDEPEEVFAGTEEVETPLVDCFVGVLLGNLTG